MKNSKKRAEEEAEHFIKCNNDREGLVKLHINDYIGELLVFIV